MPNMIVKYEYVIYNY